MTENMNNYLRDYKKPEIIVRKESETNPDSGCIPESRSTEEIINYGIVNIDKPSGPTSHQVSGYVKDILNLKKCGHSGSLDPRVTGVLPIGLGEGTKIVQALLTAGKEYICIMHIHKDADEQKIRGAINKYIGRINQLPPVRSAVKRQYRERSIYYLDILEISDRDVLFLVGCQAGTYIRKLCHDIGRELGGAHMSELRRTRVAGFTEDSCCTLQDLQDACSFYKEGNDKFLRKCIQPVESGVKHLPKVWVLDSTINSLCNGANLNIPGISKFENNLKQGTLAAVMSLKNELVCFGNVVIDPENIMKKDTGIVLKTERVFMKPGVYGKLR